MNILKCFVINITTYRLINLANARSIVNQPRNTLSTMSQLGLVSKEQCPQCREDIDRTFSIQTCPKCNGRLNPQPDVTQAKPNSKFLWIIGVIAFGLIGRTIGGFICRTVAESENQRSANMVSSNKPAPTTSLGTSPSNTLATVPSPNVPTNSLKSKR